MNCPLCTIPLQEQQRVIFENELSFVCVNIEPLTPSHIMILPKKHITSLENLTAEEAKDLFFLISRFSKHLPNQFQTKGALTILNHGELSSQEHLHFHILASDAALRNIVSSYLHVPVRKKLSLEELEAFAVKIKQNFFIDPLTNYNNDPH